MPTVPGFSLPGVCLADPSCYENFIPSSYLYMKSRLAHMPIINYSDSRRENGEDIIK